MRKQDLVEGEEYAAGSTSRHDRWNRARIKVVELNGTREVPKLTGTAIRRGIVVEFLEDSRIYRWGGKAGDVRVLDSAIEIHQTWSSYVQLKAEHDRKINAALEWAHLLKQVGDDVVIELKKLGFGEGVSYYGGRVSIQADVAAEIVEKLRQIEIVDR